MTTPQPGTWHSDASHFRRPARRDFLYAGWLGGLGLSMGNLFRLQAAAESDAPAKTSEPKSKSVIHIYLQGGFAHMDSFDPKPDVPLEYRGILDNIATTIPGVRFSSHMQETAKVADKLTVVRSMTHTEVDHARGEHSMFTGYRPSPCWSIQVREASFRTNWGLEERCRRMLWCQRPEVSFWEAAI